MLVDVRNTRRIGACWLLLIGLAEPGAADSLWDHNGSVMQLREEGTARTFRYNHPRTELRKVGVRDGTVLFDGKKTGNRFSGTAYRFSKGCGAVGYAVEGTISPNARSLTLSGRAPKRNSQCKVVDHFADVLVFRRQATAEPPPAVASVDQWAIPAARPKKQVREKIPNNKSEAGKLSAETSAEAPIPQAQARLPYAVMGCKSRDTFDQWVETFRRADPASEAKVVAQGMKTKNCAALRDGPVEIVQADDSYMCVRPAGKADCYWTLRASVR